MAGLNGCELQLGSYDTSAYPFRPALTRAAYERYGPHDWEADTDRLEDLHRQHAWLGAMGVEATDLTHLNTRATDQQAQHYRDLYMAYHPLRPAFPLAYLDFVAHEVRPLFGEDVVYQARPTLRVHMPGNVAVGEPHNDAKYGHPPEAVNFWVPVTDAFDTNTLHVQTSDADESRPIDVEHGEYLIFDGVRLFHSNRRNSTAQTRVSFDFRVIPLSQYRPSGNKSINTGLAFKIGEYYSLLTDDAYQSRREEILEAGRPTLEWEARLRRQWAEAQARADEGFWRGVWRQLVHPGAM